MHQRVWVYVHIYTRMYVCISIHIHIHIQYARVNMYIMFELLLLITVSVYWDFRPETKRNKISPKEIKWKNKDIKTNGKDMIWSEVERCLEAGRGSFLLDNKTFIYCNLQLFHLLLITIKRNFTICVSIDPLLYDKDKLSRVSQRERERLTE